MVRKFLLIIKYFAAMKVLAFVIFLGLATYSNVPTHITAEDIQIFNQMDLQNQNFNQQVELIRKVQAEVFKRAPLGDGIPDFRFREPADLMKFGQGLCYDRSRTFDKAFTYLGLKSRHIYILYKQNQNFLTAIFHKGQASHAATEVKTQKGWLFVDSNSEWIAITRSGEPVGADDVWRRFDEFENPPTYLRPPWWAIRGMYSRKGQLYGAGIPFPELNWADFLTWAVLGR